MSHIYPVPDKAIKDVSELKEGMLVWYAGAGGVCSPSVTGVYRLGEFTNEGKFAHFVYQTEKNGTYEDEYFLGKPFGREMSLLDANVLRDNKYNDWYLFRNEQDAIDAVANMKALEEIDPVVKNKKIETIEEYRFYRMEYDWI